MHIHYSTSQSTSSTSTSRDQTITSSGKLYIFSDEGTDKKDTAQNTPKHVILSEKIFFFWGGARPVTDPALGVDGTPPLRQAFGIRPSSPRIPSRFTH